MNIILTALLFFFLIFSVLFSLAFMFYMLLVFVIPLLFYGAIFANSTPKIVERMVDLANIKPGGKAVDLGSGDGRLVIAMAKRGIEAHGYEINPLLVILSKRNIKKADVSDKAFVHWQSFWNKNLSEFNIITVYGISYMMKKLETKLKKELKPNARVVSNYFIFSDWQPETREHNVYVYLKKFR